MGPVGVVEGEGLRRRVAKQLAQRAVGDVPEIDLPGGQPPPLRKLKQPLAPEGDAGHEGVARLAHDARSCAALAAGTSTKASCT